MEDVLFLCSMFCVVLSRLFMKVFESLFSG